MKTKRFLSKNIFLGMYCVFLCFLIFLNIFYSTDSGLANYPTITESDLVNKTSEIESSLIFNKKVVVKMKDATYICQPSSMEKMIEVLFANGVKYEYVDTSLFNKKTFFDKFMNGFFIFISVFFIGQFIGRMISKKISKIDIPNNGKLGSMMPDMSLDIGHEIPNIKFDNIEGCAEVKEEAKDLIKYLSNPYKYQIMGARMPKGTILYGPPGTGKTLVAKAIAGEANVPFLNVSGSDFVEMYVGVGSKRVKELFAKARKLSPCIIFIDEIDSIGSKRGSSNNSERDQTINTLLAEMDGFKENSGIMVIAATNRLELLDNALTRPGRFDKKIAVSLPDKNDRYNILKLHAKNKKFDETVDLKVIAGQTTSFSGAELENLLNEATILAVNKGKKFVSNKEIDRAFFKVIMNGDVKQNQKERKSKELELVAWHEAGHALIAKLLTDDEVTKVTILSSTSGAGGVTFHNPPEEKFFTKTDLRNNICLSYGGRAAEEILFNNHEEVTIGASSDIQSASKQIKSYILKYGMSEKFGMLDVTAFGENSASSKDIIDEARNLANELYQKTLKTLINNKDILEALANALLEKETLLDKDVDEIINKVRSYPNEEIAVTVVE